MICLPTRINRLARAVICTVLLSVTGFVSAEAQLRPDTMPREYVVQRGDNLYRIALNHGTSIAAIQEINGLDGTVISVGQVLLLDRPEAAGAGADPDMNEPEGAQTGAVDVSIEMEPTGEANDADTGAEAGAEAGAQSESGAESGRDAEAVPEADPDTPLFVEAFEDARTDESPASGAANAARPAGGAAPVSTALPPSTPGVEVIIDPVQATNAFDVTQARSGDTFVSIAQRTNVAAGVLMALNPDLSPPMADGAEVRLPIEPSALLYRVKDGDTLEQIAAWFGVPADVLGEVNGVDATALRIGQELRIPLIAMSDAAATVSDTGATVAGGGAADADAAVAEGADAEAAVAEGDDEGAEVAERDDDVGDVVVTGTANVYPARFDGRLMAIGKPYDPKKFTVSHATLELGTVVLLTNDATGRKTFAEVTDRPPAGAQYLLDVSAAVAEVLGIGQEGTSIRMQVAR